MSKYPHMFDPRTQLDYIVWHNDTNLENLVHQIMENLKPNRVVETGTHMGWTSMWFAEHYPYLPIYTVEVDPDFYRRSGENLARFGERVTRAQDHSANFLAKLRPVLKDGLTLFWLDAHWWPPVPLREECAEVAKLDRYVCLLDDFSCWEPDFSGDTFFTIAPSGGDAYLNDVSYVADKLGEKYWRPAWRQPPGGKGVGLFTKGVQYEPPGELMTEETLDEFLAKRRRSIEKRRTEPGFVVYPPHPSCGRTE